MRLLCRVLIFNYEVPCGGTDPPAFKQVIQVSPGTLLEQQHKLGPALSLRHLHHPSHAV